MAKTLVVCCDGTWNTPDQRGRPTNVTKMARAILPRAGDGRLQVVYYDEGVGVGNVVERAVGGALGSGLSENVQQAYRFLALNYETGDRIALYGFSRGAFTVRSLAGLIGLVGLLRKGDLERMPDIWQHYRTKPEDRKATDIHPDWIASRPPIDLLGVWDTVGSLGIPGNFLGRLGRSRHEFHDVTLGRSVRRAFHALAVDEHRKNFAPAIWDTSKTAPDQVVEQVWFAGAHSNVGGGYPDPLLSDAAFLWMVDRSREVIEFDQDYLGRRVERLRRDRASGALVDSSAGLKWGLLGRLDRTIGADASENVHWSTLLRLEAPEAEPAPFAPYPYSPRNLRSYLAAHPQVTPGTSARERPEGDER
ncbi:DUF2235 domain-containing protein [Sphingomonas sp. TX0522]|jgi:uncharacterized protein (DUF2235 family)|uniref:DUF2235 domain-containing protein n=1 Tax=Sphingomonas sp. TX0522 TaxID=2479205 RepID=UPI0018DF0010|nr:DUF2235 domain-containing protein [Sphingomonas sp. TX0522]MBI0532055.1 DUF2235 domain-containing protein [Sphingomonas sp. TX0522]